MHPANKLPGKAYGIMSTYAKRIESAKKAVPPAIKVPPVRYSKDTKGKS